MIKFKDSEVKKGKMCEYCNKKLTDKDYYKLCKKHQPIWIDGYKHGITEVIFMLKNLIYNWQEQLKEDTKRNESKKR